MDVVTLSKKSKKMKQILWVVLIMIVTFVLWSNTIIYKQKTSRIIFFNNSEQEQKHITTKYILLWTLPTRDPIKYFGEGRNSFMKRKCTDINCHVSFDRKLFNDVKQFDVIIFHSSDLNTLDLPISRSLHQKYVFVSMESSDYYPFCNNIFNNFFNWTLTYKLNSDELYGYISIKNKDNVPIGPKEVMHWKTIAEMDPIDEVLKRKLKTKKYAAAWFVSNCNSHSQREVLVSNLIAELKKYNLVVDIYGKCGSKQCPKSSMAECLKLLEQDYYFYLSFENSFSVDYVTEKLLHALQHYTIPIVFGGANYTRFMPNGIYLDAKKMPISQLAEKMAELINNKDKYYNYFKWHNHYSYHDMEASPETDPYCKFCSMINDDRFDSKSFYKKFTLWWSTSEKCTDKH